MNFDLIIQGPLNITSLKNLENLVDQFENIVISHWKEDMPCAIYNHDKIKIVSQPLPDRNKTFGVIKDSTFYYSLSSTYKGLQFCKSKYTIKSRSDETYSDYSVLKEKLLSDDERFVFGNIFAKPWSYSAYHIGDHMFAAKTEYLRKAYEFLYNSYTYGKNLIKDAWIIQGYPSHQTAESILAKSFLKAKGVDRSTWSSKEAFLANYDVVDINTLGNYTARWAHGNRTYHNDYKCSVNKMEDF